MKTRFSIFVLAALPLVVGPASAGIAQQAYLKASNTDAGDFLGVSVAVSGDTAVVGAYGEASNAAGINGNQSNNNAAYSGAAYVLVRIGTNWVQQAYLKASNTGANDLFGISVAVSADTVVVGAPGESSNATGVTGNQNDNSVPGSGAVYVFVRSGTNWSQQAYLKSSNPDAYDYFGFNVSVSGDTIAVGAYNESSNASGVNGNQSDNSAKNSGAAYIFVRNGTNWTQQAYLKASNPDGVSAANINGDRFGWSLSVSGDTLVVGATGESSSATGVNGNQSDNSALASGAAYVFLRSGTNWSQQAYLKASNAEMGDSFGYALSLSGDTVVVGSPGESSNATGVNGDQSDNSAVNSGAAYVFVRSGSNWSQQACLKASNTEGGSAANYFTGDDFGSAVGISGDVIAVGAPTEDSAATGVNGDQNDNTAEDAGAAYVFVRNGTNWSQQAYLKASNTEAGDFFGSLSLSGDKVIVGALREDSNATGVNSNQANNSAADSGAAYIFTGLGNVRPRLAVVRSGSTIQISWPADSTGFVLQSAATLSSGGDWQDSNLTPAEVNGQKVVTVGTTNTAGFFRLSGP